jgi:thioredoxin-like negative regulator of GroEL
MKLGSFLFLICLSVAVFGQHTSKTSNPKKTSQAQEQTSNDKKQGAEKYIQKFLEFTEKTYEVFTDEIEQYLKHPDAFIPDDEDGKILSELQKQAMDDVSRVKAKARYKFCKTPEDTASIAKDLSLIESRFLLHFDSTANRIKEANRIQYAKAKELPAEQLASLVKKNKTAFNTTLKKLSDICDKVGGQYEEYIRCNMIREALNQSGAEPVSW